MSNEFTGYDILNWSDQDRENLQRTEDPIGFCAGVEVAEEVDPRPHLKVENQGQLSSCTGNCVTTGTECLLGLQAGSFSGVPQLSRWWAYINAQKKFRGVGSDNGASIFSAVQAMKEIGAPLESTCRYPSSYTTRLPDAYEEAAKYKIKAHTVCTDWQQAISAIRGYSFLDWGTIWTRGMANLRGRFLTKDLCTEDGSRGGHSYAGVGVIKESGQYYILIANSWSENWADKGYALMDERCFDYLIKRPYTVAILCSDATGVERAKAKLDSFTMG